MIRNVKSNRFSDAQLSTLMNAKIQAVSQGYREPIAGFEAYTEGLRSGELLRVSGPAIFLDRISGNGRKYIAESVHQNIAALMPRVKAKALLGELDHPPVDDLARLAYVKGTLVSHRIDDIWWVEEEQCYYITATILDTPNGRILKTFYDAGTPLYVSLRSLLDPSRAKQHNGWEESYMSVLITIDFVTRPGFADAVMKALPVANENAFAVCESLNIISQILNKNSEHIVSFGQKFNKSHKNNHNRLNMKYAIESIVGTTANASDAFQANVNRVMLRIVEDFPEGFGFDEFNAKYQGVIENLPVGIYADTAELLVTGPEGVNAVIQLTKPLEDKYVLTKTSEVVYCAADKVIQDTVEEAATESLSKIGKSLRKPRTSRMYAVVATEDYAPTEQWTGLVNDIYNRLLANFANGFSESEFNDVLNIISDGTGCNGEIEDSRIIVTCPEKENGAAISLSKEDDKFIIGDITEYFNPQGESAATEAEIQKIIDAARFRWNNGGRERYAALEAEGEQANLSGTTVDDNAGAATQQQPYQVVEDDDDDKQNKQNAVKGAYQVIEEGTAQQTYTIVDEEPESEPTPEPSAEPSTEPGGGPDGKPTPEPTVEPGDEAFNDIVKEAKRILGMPNSKWSGNYAIEHMPVAYKHLWSGMSEAGKNTIVNMAKAVATESECLKFWQNLDFVGIEQAVIKAGGKLTAGLEMHMPKSPQETFLGGELPSRKKKIW